MKGLAVTLGLFTALGCASATLEKKLEFRTVNTFGVVTPAEGWVERLKDIGVPKEYVREFADEELEGESEKDPWVIFRYHSLGVSPGEIRTLSDSEKPGALVYFPVGDPPESFYSKGTVKIIDNLRKNYDVNLRIIEKPDEFNDHCVANPGAELLVLAGHGWPKFMVFGGHPLSFSEDKPEFSEDYSLSVDDDFSVCLDGLSQTANILLLSCSVGGGDESFAHHVMDMAGERNVIAATVPVNHYNLFVHSWYPFNASFYFCGVPPLIYPDCTFSTNSLR